jgi:thiol:disulfide interchange protein
MSNGMFLILVGGVLLAVGVVLARVTRRPKALFPLLALGALAVLDGVVLPLDEDPGWLTSLDQARAEAKATGKPLVVDCWARWCAACLELGKITFRDGDVRARLDGFVRVKLDMDAPENQKVWDDLGIAGLPFVGFLTPDGVLQKDHTLTGFEEPADFLSRLDRVQGKAASGGGAESLAARMARSGLLLTLLFVFVAGVGVSLTPCVYPLIPITMSVIGTRRTSGLGQRLALSLTFVGGLALTYTALGLVAGLTGASLGAAMQNPWVTGAVGLLFAAMALSYLDLFTLQLPGGLQDRLSGVGSAGFVGALVLGLVSGLVAAPCAGPVTLAILAHIAKTREPVLGVGLMLAFSLGLGLIFVVIGTSTEVTRRLPRGGAWMDVLKLVFAVVLFGLGFYYLGLAIPALNAPFEWLARLNPGA